jgi:GTP 3',8-cyclase
MSAIAQRWDTPRQGLIDGIGRSISYLRVSVTDRCDLRCTYCMAEDMTFLPKADVLSLEELQQVCFSFIELGVRKIRLTGGEPLVRRGIMTLVCSLCDNVKIGRLDEVTLTTNGTQLKRYAGELAEAGIRRINVSLDTLDRSAFQRITRRDALEQVLEGIEAASAAGMKVKINTVALRQDNYALLPQIITWAHRHGHDITLIETMPLGDVEGDRTNQYVSLTQFRAELESHWTLVDLPDQTGGPARYVRVMETGGRLGFITPMSHNFCATCNRVRLTCTGTLFTCLGQEIETDLRAPLRAGHADYDVKHAIQEAMKHKPASHDFHENRLSTPSLSRHMSVTGG